MKEQPLLTVENLKVSFFTRADEVHAVNGVDFSIRRGEILGVVGESGSGKSVTANAIMGLIPPPGRIVDGAIALDGTRLDALSDAQMAAYRGRDVSMIFQDPMTSLNPLYTVGDQLKEALLTHRRMTRAKARDRVVEMLSMVRIPQPELRLKQYPHEFSGGMRQRVMIAMGLLCEPKLLIADEPTTALDVTIQAQILNLIRELRDRTGTSVLFITHNLSVVSDLCDRVHVMYAGQIMESADVDEMVARPRHPYTKGLLRCVPSLTDERDKRLEPIAGSPVDLLMLPEGCPFCARCPSCMRVCVNRRPPATQAGAHRVSCWLAALEAAKGGAQNA